MKLDTYITYTLVLFSIILNGVSNAKSVKNHNIETLINNKNTSNIQISLNNTSNQISLFFDDKENLNLLTNKDENEITQSNIENINFPVEISDIFTAENNQQKKIIKNPEYLNNSNLLRDKALLNIKETSTNLKKKQQNSSIPKKIKYSEALINIKKIKSRLNAYNGNKLNSKLSTKNSDANRVANLADSEESETNLSSKDLNKITEANIKDEVLFEEFLKQKGNWRKKKYLDEDNNAFMFYNSLSLIMLSMLGGGVVGVIFILYFTFKHDNPNIISN